MIETIGLYILGYFIALYLCVVHWRDDIKNNNEGFWGDGPEPFQMAVIFLPFLWPVIVVLALPIVLLVQFIKLIVHLGLHGGLSPRLAAITRRAGR